jgi:CAAX protease family protein
MNDAAMSSDMRARFRAVPILVTALLGFALPYLAAFTAALGTHFLPLPSPRGPTLPWLYSQHGFQLVWALVAIAILKRFVPADYGLHWPREKAYIGAALLWGVFFGVLMTVVDYAPQLIAQSKPHLDYPLTQSNVVGWMFFEGIYVGPTEEIPFRALLVTYLATTMPIKLKLGRFEMYWAGIIVALIFALLHAANFNTRAWPQALGQQFYAFALGVLYAYWLEKSRSVVAPIVGHNVSDVTEYAILFLWVARF